VSHCLEVELLWPDRTWTRLEGLHGQPSHNRTSKYLIAVLENLIRRLESLTLSVDNVSKQEAKRILGAVNDRLASALSAHLVDLYWHQPARDGVILNPFAGCDKNTGRGEPKPYYVTEESQGIWRWVYHRKETMFIEDILAKKPFPDGVRNEVTGQIERLEARHLDFFRDTDAIVAVPLFFKEVVWGIYSVEWPKPGGQYRPSVQETVRVLQELSRTAATILWKADAFEENRGQTERAINTFCERIQEDGADDFLSAYKFAFVARPFQPEFNPVETCLRNALEPKGVRAHAYSHPIGQPFVIEDIMKQVRAAHFGIIDITGHNPNVLLELGTMASLGKRRVILRRKGDRGASPFNLKDEYVLEYALEGGQMRIWREERGEPESLESVLGEFVEGLQQDGIFRGAREYVA